jgi:hypothetical protein
MPTSRRTIVWLACGIALVGCKSSEPARSARTETRTLPPFHSVRVSAALRVDIERAGTASVVVRGDADAVSKIETLVRDGVLVVRPREALKAAGAPLVELKLPRVDTIVATASALISAHGFKQPLLRVDCSSAAHCDAAGDIEVIHISAQGGAVVRAGGALTREVTIEAESGANVRVRAIGAARGYARSGATIEVMGSPKERAILSTTGASVVFR